MTMSDDLFRREALEFWSRQRGPGAVLRVAASWVRWLYWIGLALVVVGLALAFFARIDQTISGPALVNPQKRTFVAVLPAVASLDLQGSQPLRLEVDGPSGRQYVAARPLRVEAANDAEIHRAGFGSFPQPAILMTGVLAPDVADQVQTPSSPHLTGRAVVVVGSKQAFTVFLHGFKGAPEGGNS